MLDATEAIRTFVQDAELVAFRQDRRTVDAVVRNLEVIGEAARHVPEDVRQQYPDIPWADIIGMRSILIHEYFGVDFDILWSTIQNDLAALVPRLQIILDETEEP